MQVSAAIFTLLEPDLLFFDAFYHCYVTATTVGYGDVALTTPASRLCASAHILVSVSWLAALIGQVEESAHVRSSQMRRAALLTKPLEKALLLSLDKVIAP